MRVPTNLNPYQGLKPVGESVGDEDYAFNLVSSSYGGVTAVGISI